jgi:hypothetical protein
MHDWIYTLRERFTPDSGERWKDYLAFSLFRNVTELVTLDSLLCPDLIENLLDDDWNHNIHEDFRTTLFRDPEYLLGRQPLNSSRHQLLAILERPDGSENVPFGFTRCGFDIMDSYVGNSTLTNCGPIPEAFDPSIVNDFGLLDDCTKAIEVRDRMRRLQPDDPHLGACEVWSVARALPRG